MRQVQEKHKGLGKQSYERYSSMGDYDLREIEVLPKCKRVTQFGYPLEYQLVRRKFFFGLFSITYWVDKRKIIWYTKPTVEYYNCDMEKK